MSIGNDKKRICVAGDMGAGRGSSERKELVSYCHTHVPKEDNEKRYFLISVCDRKKFRLDGGLNMPFGGKKGIEEMNEKIRGRKVSS